MTTESESRPNFATEPEFIEAVRSVGRKRLAYAIHDPEIREWLGFGLLQARETVARVLAERGGSQSCEHAQNVIATLAEMPPLLRSNTSLAMMTFKVWESFTGIAKKHENGLSRLSPKGVARMLMQRMLRQSAAKNVAECLSADALVPQAFRGAGGGRHLADAHKPNKPRPIHTSGPIVHAAQAGIELLSMSAKAGGALCDHPDGLVQAIGALLGLIGSLLMQYDPLSPDLGMREDRAACEGQLRALLLASEKAGFKISEGPLGGIPNPDNMGWCARQVRSALAEIDFLDLPPGEGWPAEPAIPEDALTIAQAFETRWSECTNRRCPVTSAAAVSAVRDMKARLDEEWSSFDPQEKARQVVMTCLKLAGVKKPSSLFDADRKREERAELERLGARKPRRTPSKSVRRGGGQ